jgi:hypothetical protein
MPVEQSNLRLRELDLGTVASVGTSGGCCACGSMLRVRMTAPSYALGVSANDLEDHLAGIPLCADCAGRSTQAVRAFGRLLYVVPMLPFVVTVAALFLAPLPVWGAGTFYVLAVVLAGVALRALRGMRARLAPVLVVEARARTLTLQVATRVARDGTEGGPYRSPSVTQVGLATHLRPPNDHLGFSAPAMALVGGVLSLWAWFFANPLIVLDNAASLAARVQIDGNEVRPIPGVSREILRLHIGRHVLQVRPSVGSAERIEVEVAVGKNQLFAVARGCYHITSHRTTRAHRWSTLAADYTTEGTVSGRWIAIGDPLDVVPAECPQGSRWPRF